MERELEQLLIEIEIAMDLGLPHERGDGLPVAAAIDGKTDTG